eukprot:gene14759-16301_t
MGELQAKDPSLAQLLKYLQSGELPGNSSDDRKIISKADQIIRKLSSVNVELDQGPRKKSIVHVNRLKPYLEREARPTETLDNVDSNNDESD